MNKPKLLPRMNALSSVFSFSFKNKHKVKTSLVPREISAREDLRNTIESCNGKFFSLRVVDPKGKVIFKQVVFKDSKHKHPALWSPSILGVGTFIPFFSSKAPKAVKVKKNCKIHFKCGKVEKVFGV